MGGNKTVEWWDEFVDRTREKHNNGNGHGKSLTIELKRLPAGRWGEYADAIERWEATLGRPAPEPTVPTGRGGAHRLSPAFDEWLMGLPHGWVTDVPGMTDNEAIRACGNGVVPQQFEALIVDCLDAFSALVGAA
jgi:DNA (cytosine-5)-methyltransferase 1